MKNLSFKNVVLLFPALLSAITFVSAQRLPGVQETSVRIPANFKIDGTATEWGDKFQAFNHNTETAYTIANDDKYLYLIAKASDNFVINRIVSGGITLAIQLNSKRNEKNSITITYPVIPKGTLFFNLLGKKGTIPDTTAKAADLLMKNNNARLARYSKWIVVKGVKDIDDTISVYNTNGIKALGVFDNKKAYIYELAMPLNLLGLNAVNAQKFAYHLRINSGNPPTIGMGLVNPSGGSSLESIGFNEFDAKLSAVTDFWGEYTLAK